MFAVMFSASTRRPFVTSANTLTVLRELPCTATNADALAWVARMRRRIDRWESLPEHGSRSMSPDLRRRAREELDEVEHSVRRNMSLRAGA